MNHTYVVIKKLITFFLFQTVAIVLFAQQIQVRNIPHIEQLPIGLINVFFQDSEGYMWYGTEDGLCRNDGYNIHVIRSDYQTPNLFSSNSISCLAEDSIHHNIWIGTAKGLYHLNKRTYNIKLIPLSNKTDNKIENIYATSDGSIWIGVFQKLYQLNSHGTLIKEYPIEYNSIGGWKNYVLYETPGKQLWLSISGKGMHRWDKQSKSFQLFFPYQEKVNAIIPDQTDSCYWLATWDHSLIRFNPKADNIKESFIHQPLPVNSIGQTATTAIDVVRDDIYGYFWVASWSHLFVFEKKTDGNLQQINTTSFLPSENRALRDILKDKNSNLWITTKDTHNFRICFNNNNVQRYDIPILQHTVQWQPNIAFLCKDNEPDIFWFYQWRLGLCLYNAHTEQLNYFNHLPDKYRFWNLAALVKSPKSDRVWLSPEYTTRVYGLNQKKLNIQIEQQIDLTDISKYPKTIRRLYEGYTDDLWIAAGTSLYRYHISEKYIEIVSDSIGTITGMTQTKDGDLWCATEEKGLACVNRQNILTKYPFPQKLRCIAVADSLLWMATDKGELLSFCPQNEEVRNHNTTCGINGNQIYSLTADTLGHLWIVTSQTIKEFNPQNGAYRTFSAFDKNINFNIFMPQAVCTSSNGRMYFGGVPGILAITPSNLRQPDSNKTKAHITDIQVMGNSIFFNTNRKNNSNKIFIRPGEQNIQFFFSSLDHQHISRIRYAYRLSNIDKDWIYLPEGQNFASYNRLKKGSYKFEVRVTDENGLWSNEITTLDIQQLPFWYETWWAYSLYTIIIASILLAMLRNIRNRIRLRQILQIQKIEQAKAEEINHAKLQFFTNITHELLTPLSIISASVDELKQVAPTYQEQYGVITNNITRLIRLLQQILEFRKSESGNLKLRVSQGDLSAFVRRSVEAFRPLLKKKNMHFSIYCHPETFIAWFDPDKLDKILYNLLSNAAKYSRPDGTVQVHLTKHPENPGSALLIVKDNGPGISKEVQKDLFKRFYEGEYRKYHTIGTGIGLSLVNDLVRLHHGNIKVKSEEGHGATFIVSLPYECTAYPSEEIDSSYSSNLPEEIINQKNIEINISPSETKSITHQPKNYNLLLVEDNTELLQLMVKLLTSQYTLYTATNGKEALELIEKTDIDLIVSDIMMPVMDGITFCKTLKESFETCHIPLILLTAKKQEEDRIQAYLSGADAFINKPFSLQVLQARIKNLITARERKGYDFRKRLVFEAKQTDYTSMDQDFLQRAIDCINRHLDNPEFNQDLFIEEMHTTKSTSLRKLKSLTGMNFVSFVRNIRMKAACRLMEENHLIHIAELAYAVGYNDPRYFTISFKKEFDMTPQEYLKQLTEREKE